MDYLLSVVNRNRVVEVDLSLKIMSMLSLLNGRIYEKMKVKHNTNKKTVFILILC